ncbi:MAG TPA: MopE-related protein [Candidatus Polarisedimenticolia bacterium]|nr:MopE-related protein [Candidatus Polarisedimenticolia bacterium]
MNRRKAFFLAAGLTCALAAAGATPAQAQEFKKTVTRVFPVFFWCPIDPALTLSFTATGPEAILSVSGNNFTGTNWNAQAVDDIAVVSQSVFQAHQLVTPGYETCYSSPGTPNTPGYDFVGGSPEAYLNLFDANASGWDLGSFAYWNGISAPRDPSAGDDVSGGSLALGHTDDGSVPVTASTHLTGLVPGTTYVVTGWWYTQQLTNLTLDVDFNLPKTLTVPGASFTTYESTTHFPDHSDGMLRGSEQFVAALPLKHGATLLDMTLVAEELNPYDIINLTLRRVDHSFYGPGNPQILATATLDHQTISTIETITVPLSGIVLDLDHYSYSLEIMQQNSGVTHGVRVRYKDPTPGASESIDIAGLAFDARVTGTDVKWGNYGVILSGNGTGAQGHYVAPIRLPQGATVTGVAATAFDEVTYQATVRLMRIPVTAGYEGATPMAVVNTTGVPGDPIRTYATSSIANPVIDNSTSYYYLDASIGAILDIYGVRITWTPPASPPAWDADTLAALPFLTEVYGTDARTASQDTLAGQYRFDMGVSLPDGEQVLSFSISAFDNSTDGDMTAFLYRTDNTIVGAGSQLMATLTSQGQAASVRQYTTDLIQAGRVIDNTRYFYYVQFWTGFEPVTASGMKVTTAPCGDHDGDGFNGCVNDCNDNRATVYPGAPEVCGDGMVNNCSRAFWPDPTGTNEGDDDFDGFSECQGDCNDADASRWSPPSDPQNLMVSFDTGTGVTTLTWSPPANPGGNASPVYDTVRSFSPSNFGGSAVCVESNGPDTTSTLTTPALTPGQGLFFLVRAESSCGPGPLGFSSAGVSILGRGCP